MKKIVIIGGGFSGTYAARKLEKKFRVTLIDTKNYFEFTPGILRTIVFPEHRERIESLHSKYLKRTSVVKDRIISIDLNKNLVIGKKTKNNFDYLIIASGSKYTSPIKEENIILTNRAKEIEKEHEKIEKAKEIVIVGGGLVGIELAGEISEKYTTKKIKIIHSKEKLIERTPERASKHAEKILRKRGVEILLNEIAKDYKNKKVKTENGKEIRADIVFFCTGIIPNSGFISENLKDKKGHIKVNKKIQMIGNENIFAPGDVNDFAVEKTAQNAIRQSKTVVRNIINLEKNKKLKEYEEKPTPLVISLGKWNGMFISKKIVLTGIIPGIMKTMIEWYEMKKYRK